MASGIKKAEVVLDPWVTLPQAAELLGIHKQTVLKHAADGKLEHEVRGHWRFFTRESVMQLKQELDAA